MNTEYVSQLEETGARRTPRVVAIEALGPLTMLGGVVWAVAQPYRVALFHPAGKGLYDWLVQPPLLVVAVGLIFAALIVPGLVDDLRGEEE
jgi:hypothetical protein